MLSFHDGFDALSRRRLLTIGALGGIAGPACLSDSARGGEAAGSLSGKSVIFLFQQGGPSQLETFDPKPNAPQGVRTVTGVTQTKVPGITFGDTMSQLAPLADRLSIVRSYQSGNGGHNIKPIVGEASLEANIGVHYARIAGATDSKTGMPTNAVLFPATVCDDVSGPQARGNLASVGDYGSKYTPFQPGGKGPLQQNMQVRLPKGRFFDDRRQLLKSLDRLDRQIDAAGEIQAMDDLQRQTYELLLGGGVRKALDLSQENAKTVAAYDTSRFARKGRWDKVSRGKRGYYYGQAKSIGKLLLLARRLCETGCGFVTIHAGYAGVWDMHADRNNLNMVDGMQAVGPAFDHAIAAFIKDLESRGLSDKIMLVATGEMGRTPRINKRGGRDHWSRLAPLLLYGGGMRGGRVIGSSTKDGGEPATKAYGPSHLISTILHTLFDVGELRLAAGVPPQVMKLTESQPIPKA